ncbi:MAG: four helix bundle protein [Candidatus Edwardsbacteria bacterium]|nr:four helix bundle protein [Candidatus Edwardsbacteria bacterium]
MKNANRKMQNVNYKCKVTPQNQDLSERLLDFAVAIIKLTESLSKTYAGAHISKQLIRAGSSAGANYEESWGAESRNDFIHKMPIVLKRAERVPVLAQIDPKNTAVA